MALEAPQVLLLVLDGLGWQQLERNRALMPLVASMQGGPITSVFPSTTATALTSITTGLSPGEHGVVGYRIDVHGDVLNVLRWSTAARRRAQGDPTRVDAAVRAFPRAPTSCRHEGRVPRLGVLSAHLRDVQWRGWRVPSTLITEVRSLLGAGEPFVYAYYDGIDKVAHEYGLGAHYEAELVWVDRLVGDLLEVMPPGAVLVITADHGQVDVGDNVWPLDPLLVPFLESQSGEAPVRAGSTRGPGAPTICSPRRRPATATTRGSPAVTRSSTRDGSAPGSPAASIDRLGDVVLVARADVAFDDPADSGPFKLIARHGSLTAEEMLVPPRGVERG